MRTTSRKIKRKRNYTKEEINLYIELIEAVEFEITNERLLINGLPIKIKNREVVIMNEKTLNDFDENTIIFKPLRSHPSLELLLEKLIQVDENEYELKVTKYVTKSNKGEFYYFISELLDGETKEVLCKSGKSNTEIEAKFKTLVKYILPDKDIDNIIDIIRKNDKKE